MEACAHRAEFVDKAFTSAVRLGRRGRRPRVERSRPLGDFVRLRLTARADLRPERLPAGIGGGGRRLRDDFVRADALTARARLAVGVVVWRPVSLHLGVCAVRRLRVGACGGQCQLGNETWSVGCKGKPRRSAELGGGGGGGVRSGWGASAVRSRPLDDFVRADALTARARLAVGVVVWQAVSLHLGVCAVRRLRVGACGGQPLSVWPRRSDRRFEGGAQRLGR